MDPADIVSADSVGIEVPHLVLLTAVGGQVSTQVASSEKRCGHGDDEAADSRVGLADDVGRIEPSSTRSQSMGCAARASPVMHCGPFSTNNKNCTSAPATRSAGDYSRLSLECGMRSSHDHICARGKASDGQQIISQPDSLQVRPMRHLQNIPPMTRRRLRADRCALMHSNTIAMFASNKGGTNRVMVDDGLHNGPIFKHCWLDHGCETLNRKRWNEWHVALKNHELPACPSTHV